MKPGPVVVFVVLLTFLAATARRSENEPTGVTRSAARFVPAEIVLDGTVVLRGSTSDDGRADVDAVWDYQLGGLAYAPTEAFAALGVPADAKEWVLELPAAGAKESEAEKRAEAESADATKPRRRGPDEWAIEVLVSYGGEARARTLRLVRGKKQPGSGGDWYLHPDEVRRLFGARLVRREDVPHLEDPTRTK